MRFDQPTGTQADRDAAQAWAGGWLDATPIGTYYQLRPGVYAYHTGADLNLPNYADSLQPVYASADGVVVYAGTAGGFAIETVVIKHAGAGEDGADVWTRYSHITQIEVEKGDVVKRGRKLGVIGDYAPVNNRAGDHLHFDVARIDLGARPGDWPGTDRARLLRDYVDPRAWINAHRVEEVPIPMADKWTSNVVSPDPRRSGTRVRFAPDTTQSNVAGKVMPGDVVEGELVAGEGGQWVRMRATPEKIVVSGVTLTPSAIGLDVYAAAEFMDPVTAVEPPPAPTPAPVPPPVANDQTPARLLGVHELDGHGKARQSLELGAQAVMVFEDALGAYQMAKAWPNAIVMHRKYFQGFAPAPREIIAQHGINPDLVSDSRVWYRGLNENDHGAEYDSSPDGIRRRAAWDLQCAAILKRAAPNARWVAGGWAHGNPDFTQQAVCDAIREGYAAAYNRGEIAFDLHNYSKSNPANPKDYRFYAPIWFERRWEFLFSKCGFDPRVRAIVASEAGIEAGHGGFRWAQFSRDEFIEWARYYMQVQTAPLVINGVSYPSPYVAGTLFQWGDNETSSGGWWGYGLDEYIGWLAEAWTGRAAVSVSTRDMALAAPVDLYAGAGIEPGYEPAPKVWTMDDGR